VKLPYPRVMSSPQPIYQANDEVATIRSRWLKLRTAFLPGQSHSFGVQRNFSALGELSMGGLAV
jgi:hypothetical protein